jgi:ABC-type cobalt transport system substrate-binding protein
MKLEFITLGVILAFLGAFAYVSSTGHYEWSGADSQAETLTTKLT